METRVGIVGGGASGMMAAITAARLGARVLLFEGNNRLGKKLLATGNGKCNLGNETLGKEAYYTGEPKFLESCLSRFGTEDAVSFFEGLGLMLKSKNGYLYPKCEQAQAVLDVLRYEVVALGVEVVTDCKVERISREPVGKSCHKFKVQGAGKDYWVDRLILACGGRAAPKTGSDGSGFLLAKKLGHSVTRTVPALVQLQCAEEYFKAVSGVRAEAALTVYRQGKCAAAEQGELQITDYGISGIPVFQLSRVVNMMLEESLSQTKLSAENGGFQGRKKYACQAFLEQGRRERGTDSTAGIEIGIDFFPEYTKEAYERMITDRSRCGRRGTVEEFFTGMLHKKLMLLFIKLSGLKPSEALHAADAQKIRKVYDLCRNWRVHVTGSNSYDAAQACAGGVPLGEVGENLESKYCPGLYFAGEILDVDGKCGGYNLHWAWCSGYLAGKAAICKGQREKKEGGFVAESKSGEACAGAFRGSAYEAGGGASADSGAGYHKDPDCAAVCGRQKKTGDLL